MPSNYERLLQYSLWLISKKRYTFLEVRKKLKQFIKKHHLEETDINEEREDQWKEEAKDSAEEAIERVIERLTELNYLNDANYARDYVNDRLKLRPRGKFLLKRELKLKGIDSEIIASTLDNVEVDELTMAMDLIKKRRFNLNGNLDRKTQEKEKARAFSFLSSKGFNKEIIYKAVIGQYNSD